MRDHIRYVDEIVCAAARIVKAVRERAKRKSASNKNGEYDSMHVRRGDFQYKNVKVGIDKIYAESKEALKDHGTIYIATDEKKKDFFLPLKAQQYDVTFLDDYKDLIQGVNPSYYGMFHIFIKLNVLFSNLSAQNFMMSSNFSLNRYVGPIGSFPRRSIHRHLVFNPFWLRQSDERLSLCQK